jgi:glycosyltransferase involved in cell wall biosynthesis
VLLTVHSMWSGAGGILRLAALAGLRRWPVAWSAVSGAAADAFRRSLGGVEVSVLPNAVDVADWRPPPAAAAGATAGVTAGEGEPLTVISVMRLARRKRPLHLLRSFEQLRRVTGRDDVRLVVVGDGRLRRRAERFVRRHRLGDRVRITGRLSRDEVRAELAAASVYVAPAPRESFGIAVLEARCAGLPIVASRHSGVGEFVRDRVDGVLVGSDAEMVAALADLVCDPGLRDRIAAHNRAAAPPFDWSDALRRTAELYRAAGEVAAARPGVLAGPEPLAAGA